MDGEVLDFLFDTGATGQLTDAALNIVDDENEAIRGASFITQTMYDKWRARHPEWRIIEKADRYGVDQPKRFGNGAMIQVPYVEIAGIKSGPVWFTTRPDSNFHDYMSQWMDKRVEGALGGSALKYFSIIIDYPNSTAYFKK